MTQPQKQTTQQTEPIFERKSVNKYDGKVFDMPLAEIYKRVSMNVTPSQEQDDKDEELVPEDKKVEMAIYMEKAKTPEQKAAMLREADPRNSNQYFEAHHSKWARDNSRTYTDSASIRSKVSFWIGSTLFFNPADKNLPDYVFYLPKDRATVFRGHFDPKTYNARFVTSTNRRILELRDELQKRIAFWFLIFGLAFGGFAWSATKIHNGYVYVSNKIAANGDQEKFKQQQLDSLKTDAIALVEEYKAGKITDSQFLARKNELKARELEINKQ